MCPWRISKLTLSGSLNQTNLFIVLVNFSNKPFYTRLPVFPLRSSNTQTSAIPLRKLQSLSIKKSIKFVSMLQPYLVLQMHRSFAPKYMKMKEEQHPWPMQQSNQLSSTIHRILWRSETSNKTRLILVFFLTKNYFHLFAIDHGVFIDQGGEYSGCRSY